MATVTSASQMRRAQMAATIASRVVNCRRVLQVITPSHMSGAEMQLVRLTRQMRARGHEMPVLVKHDSPAIEHMLEKGLSVDRRASAARSTSWRSRGSPARPGNITSIWCNRPSRPPVGGPAGSKRSAGQSRSGHVQGFTSARWHQPAEPFAGRLGRRARRPRRAGHFPRQDHRADERAGGGRVSPAARSAGGASRIWRRRAHAGGGDVRPSLGEEGLSRAVRRDAAGVGRKCRMPSSGSWGRGRCGTSSNKRPAPAAT